MKAAEFNYSLFCRKLKQNWKSGDDDAVHRLRSQSSQSADC